MVGDILLFKNIILILFLISPFYTNFAYATDDRICDHEDYNYVPHPDQSSKSDPSKTYRMRIEHNPDFVGANGGTSAYYYLDTLDPQTAEIYSTIKMPFDCSSSGYIHCTLNVKGRPKPYPYERVDIGVLKNFSSGNMKNHVPYALSIAGLTFTTKNFDDADEAIIKRP